MAKEFARHFCAELVVIHVLTPVEGPLAPGASQLDLGMYYEQLKRVSQERLDRLVEEEFSSDMEVRAELREGRASDAIVGAAEAYHADLIIIATHGTSGWRRLMFGSVADQVIRAAPCPLLTIRAPAEKEEEAQE